MRRLLGILLTGGLLILSSSALATGASAATIAPTTTCSNGVDNTPGLGLICEVTVVNTITATGGSATVTVRECHGAAGDPEAACTTVTDDLTEPVTQSPSATTLPTAAVARSAVVWMSRTTLTASTPPRQLPR